MKHSIANGASHEASQNIKILILKNCLKTYL